MTTDRFRIAHIDASFDEWRALLDLIIGAFAYMTPLIDPPSSALRLTTEALRDKAEREVGFVIRDGSTLAACMFCLPEAYCLYVGKLAVAPAYQGRGLGRRLVQCAEEVARQRGLPALRLQTRIQLAGNHSTFKSWGFVKTGESMHAGFTEPTTIEMRKPIAAKASGAAAM